MEKRDVCISSMKGPWGDLWMASTEDGLCAISIRGGKEGISAELSGRRVDFSMTVDGKRHREAEKQLEEYFAGKRKAFDVPLDLWGTPFQQEVWKALLRIPYGETRSYRDIAQSVGSPKAVRAVGGANGKNPVPVIVPCHRVIRSDGNLGGYGGGLDIKRELLDLENGQV